ncbi:MAG: PilZ domain-containing protein [Candidatus Omnitrophica bacterium]|nr:PilZ domain-containing protein [Candidatus Omnitrophota bacterium]
MWDGFNKRKFPRVNIQCQVVIHPHTAPKPIEAVTENLGARGACVLLNEPLERFTPCRIRLELKKDKPAVECSARTVWIVKTQEGRSRTKYCYDTGIEFLEMSDSDSQNIREFIEEHLSQSPA